MQQQPRGATRPTQRQRADKGGPPQGAEAPGRLGLFVQGRRMRLGLDTHRGRKRRLRAGRRGRSLFFEWLEQRLALTGPGDYEQISPDWFRASETAEIIGVRFDFIFGVVLVALGTILEITGRKKPPLGLNSQPNISQ